jgi:hypothetical protein
MVVALLCAAPAQAKVQPDVTFKSMGQVARWAGENPDPTGAGYGPPTQHSCSDDTCDSFVIDVQLPPGSFPKGPKNPSPPGIQRTQAEGPTDMPGDGLLVSIKWATDFDQWNLYVDDMSTGQTVAQGSAVDSNAQSVLIPQPHNGKYRVTVVPFMTATDKADLKYTGEVRSFLDPTQRVAGKKALMPQIETEPPSNFHIADIPPVPSNPTGWRFTPNGTFENSCYSDETAEYGATRCLRFDNNIRNVGQGPLILRFNYSPDAVAGNCAMHQEILSTDATVAQRDAGPCVFHAPHGHFHYQNMGRYDLYAVDAAGHPSPKAVATSQKIGFCTIDVDDWAYGRPANEQRPRTYSFPACNIPNAYTTEMPTSSPYTAGEPEYMGISVGWGDIYTWDLPTQFIDISKNVPDGVYEVASRSNFDGGILTSDRSREMGITCIRITGTKVEVVRELPPQSIDSPLPSCAETKASASELARRIKIAHLHGRAAKYDARWRRHGAALRAKVKTGSATGATGAIYRVNGKVRTLVARTKKTAALGTGPTTLKLSLVKGARIRPGLYVSEVRATIEGVKVKRARSFRLR